MSPTFKLTNLIAIFIVSQFIVSSSALASPNNGQHNDRKGPPAFSTLDLNSDGSVTLEEFQQHSIPHGDHATVFNNIDANGDGTINQTELSEHKPPHRGKSRPER